MRDHRRMNFGLRLVSDSYSTKPVNFVPVQITPLEIMIVAFHMLMFTFCIIEKYLRHIHVLHVLFKRHLNYLKLYSHCPENAADSADVFRYRNEVRNLQNLK